MLLRPFCSNFDVLLSVFCKKVVQNGNAEGYAEISAEVTHEAIDDPSHRRTVGGDCRLEVQASGRNSGNYDQVGLRKDRRSTNHPDISLIRPETDSLPDVEENLSLEQREALTDCKCLDGPCCWSLI